MALPARGACPNPPNRGATSLARVRRLTRFASRATIGRPVDGNVFEVEAVHLDTVGKRVIGDALGRRCEWKNQQQPAS